MSSTDPSTSSQPPNITSTVDHLESGSYLRESVTDADILEVDRRLDEFTQWLCSDGLLVMLRNRSYQLSEKLGRVKKAVKRVRNWSGDVEMGFFVCGVCKEDVFYSKLTFWKDVQQHEHLEVLWARCVSGGQVAEDILESASESDSVIKQEGYDEEILTFCYPSPVMRKVFEADNIPLYTLQFKASYNAWCLLCRCNAGAYPSLLTHVRGHRHQNRKNILPCIQSLTAYHHYFSALPPDYQAHQICFSPCDVRNARCYVCKIFVNYSDLTEHIETDTHKISILNKKSIKNTPIFKKAFSIYTDNQAEHLEFPLRDELPRETLLEQKPPEFRFNFTPQYAGFVQSACYPSHVSKKCCEIDNTSDFTVQVKSETQAFCLICRCELPNKMPTIILHLEASKHKQNLQNTNIYSQMTSYHSAFIKLPPEIQSQVVYFVPSTLTMAACLLCSNSEVDYGAIEEHIFYEAHKKALLDRLSTGKEYLLQKATEVYGKRQYEKIIEVTSPSRSEGSGSNSTNSPVRNGLEEKKKNVGQPKIVHDVVKSITNPDSLSVLEQLENRFRAHFNLLEERPMHVTCRCCSVSVLKTPHEIRKHLISEAHKQKACVPNRKYKFICEICNWISSKEIAWQDHLIAHKTRCEEIPQVRRNKLTEYECRTCSCILFGDMLSVKRHQMVYREKNKKNKPVVLNDAVKMLFRSEAYLEEVVEQMVAQADAVVAAQGNVWACCKALEEALSTVFPNCRAYPFGSRVSGLGNQNSDLDVFVDIGNMYKGNLNQDAKSQEKIITDAYKVLREIPGKVFSNVNQIPTARTPIIQVYHKVTELDCDLSFRHGLSVENTKFLRVCIGLQPFTQRMILLLKCWSHYSKLDEHISTYALSMMVIFYLQVQGHLLSIKKLKELNPQTAMVIDGWDTLNYTLELAVTRNYVKPFFGTLKQLLMGFFKYYSEFKFNTDVICPLLGHTIPRSFFQGAGEALPVEMKSYVVKLQMPDRDPEFFRAMSPLCVQDPFDLSHNLTKACPRHILNKIKILCDLTFKHLEMMK